MSFARGISLFLVVLTVFFLVQTAVFVRYCVAGSETLRDLSWTEVLQDPMLYQVMQEMTMNGDAVSAASFWSGAVGLVVLLVLVVLWRGTAWKELLGMRLPRPKAFLVWLGVFMLLALAVEGLAYLSPAFRTDFMGLIVGSATDRWMLFLGIGIMPALFEEALIRGLLMGSLRFITHEHLVVAVSAGVFALMHLQYAPMIMLLVLAMGVVLGYARTRTASLWVPIILHMLNNVLSLAFAEA
ncbi:MAG: CPBP family intramembrane metalloprotease [Flavobacteriales bacterium]|nr:CPBP family intramembrane metalloprotease [Flavobacteriales bacterium]